jgi:hypothetical protein
VNPRDDAVTWSSVAPPNSDAAFKSINIPQ